MVASAPMTVLNEIKRLREQNRDITNDDILLIQLIEIRDTLNIIDKRLETVEEHTRVQTEYPSIPYLLRYHPRQTITVMMTIFILLSLWWVSGFRQPILNWLNLPIF